MEHFITNIQINHLRGGVTDLAIPLSKDRRQHLIITGKNGSGKTSLLLELYQLLSHNDGIAPDFDLTSDNNLVIDYFPNEQVIYNLHDKGKFLMVFFGAKRNATINLPKGIKKIPLKEKYGLKERANIHFLQYLVNLKADRSFARDENDEEVVHKINNWFQRFENRLKYIFGVDEFELKFDRKTYTFDIVTNKSDSFNLSTLSDGYASILSIVAELILRMEAHHVKAYDLEGIVLIDEIETPLHIDLQKKILPFLTDFFPKIQFIVTTYSPFVLSSVSNATVCDLETRIVTTDLSNYSYDAIIESYFQVDKYSDIIKRKVVEFEALTDKNVLTDNDRDQLIKLRDYLAHAPKHLAPELKMKLQEIRLKELARQKSR